MSPAAATSDTPRFSGYALDAEGRLHPFGGAPQRLPGRVWEGVGIMRRIVLCRDGSGGYVADCWGGVFPFGDAPRLRCHGLFPGADVIRDVALIPDERWGYVLDTDGGVHRLGTAPWALDGTCRGKVDGKASALAMRTDGRSGYVLGRSGAVRAFGDAPEVTAGEPPAEEVAAVDLVLLDDDHAGLVLWEDGTLAGFGGAPSAKVKIGRSDRATRFDALPSGGGYVLTAKGRMVALGGAQPMERFPRGLGIVDIALAGRPVVPPPNVDAGYAGATTSIPR